MLAYGDWAAAGMCRSCGTHKDWWDPKKGGHRHAFVAEADRCPGCEVKEQLVEQLPKGEKGIHVHLIPRPTED